MQEPEAPMKFSQVGLARPAFYPILRRIAVTCADKAAQPDNPYANLMFYRSPYVTIVTSLLLWRSIMQTLLL